MTRRLPATLVACLLALSLSLAGCALPGPQAAAVDPDYPEGASGWVAKAGTRAAHSMVVAAHPLAAQAGYQVLQQGGSAVDAAIAIQMMLTLVEPQSSGIGGGAFLLHTDGKQVVAWDGRETAPQRATPDLLLGEGGKPIPFATLASSGRSVGVPGVVRMLEAAHREHGRLPWAALFVPAIRAAEEGFPVSPRLATLLAREARGFDDPDARAYFLDADGKPLAVGTTLKNPRLAAVLRRVASEGADAFYRGTLARAIVDKVGRSPRNPGLLALDDLARYRAVRREPVCGPFLRYRVCGMPPPSSGGIAVLQMLGVLERKGIAGLRPVEGVPGEKAVHLFAEAGRLAFADRARYAADVDFVALPGGSPSALLAQAYLDSQAARIGEASLGVAAAGTPVSPASAYVDGESGELASTSHLSVVDGQGNAVAMTTSIERGFGTRLMVEGFLLNNQLTDFSFLPRDRTGLVANRVEGGKRPRSAMSPTLVFDGSTGELLMSLGSPGGPAIINYVARTLVASLAWDLDLQQAISLPNFGSRNGPTEVEAGRFPGSLVNALRRRGHTVVVGEQTSGLHGVQKREEGGRKVWLGAADPRREGMALGD